MAKKKSKSKFPRWAKILLGVVLLFALVIAVYENQKYFRRAYRYFSAKYIKTDWKKTDFPDKYSLHGIDVSHYQDEINWKLLKAINTYGDTIDFRFVIIKATEGLLIEDKRFDEYWEDVKAEKITRGAYHYFLPDRSPKIQAANFINSVKLQKGDLPPIVDIEETKGKKKKDIVKNLKEFITILEKTYGVRPIIYSNISFIEDYLMDDFANYSFWIAHYYQKELKVENDLTWVIWQHSDKADLLGVKGRVDANVFYGSEEKFNRLLIE